jgi:LiaF transmembrane domain
MIYASRSRKGVFVGLLIVAFGLVLFLDQEGIVSAHYVYRFFWPALFIFFGLEFLISCRFSGGRGLVGFLMLAFGLLLLTGALGYLNVGFQTLWPLALIIWGVWVITRSFGGDRGLTDRIRGAVHDSINAKIHDDVHNAVSDAVANDPKADWRARRDWRRRNPHDWADSVKSAIQDTFNDWTGQESTDPEFDYMAIFGGIKQRVTVKNFRGGRLTAVFGGFEVDLTRADIDGPTAMIDASALFGGGEIRVPPTWIIEIRGIALLGGYTDETHQEVADPATAKRLIVKGIAALGGVVIKN